MPKTLWALFVAFVKIGLTGFGGGNNLISLVQAEAVPRFIASSEFSELVGAQFAFPGLSAVKLAGLIGLRAAGVIGLLVATSALVLPGLLMMALLYTYLTPYRDTAAARKVLLTLQYAGSALIAVTLWSLLLSATKGRLDWRGLALMAAIVIAVERYSVSPLYCVMGAMLIGLVLY